MVLVPADPARKQGGVVVLPFREEAAHLTRAFSLIVTGAQGGGCLCETTYREA
jgi:hypothetical protein